MPPTPQPRRALPGSMFFVATGQGNNGKTEQVIRLLTSRWPDGTAAVAPFLFLVVESSSEGTAGAVLADPAACLVWPVDSIEEANDAIKVCFPEHRPPLSLGEARREQHRRACAAALLARRSPPVAPAPTPADHLPLGGLGVDSASTLLAAQKTVVRETARTGKDKTSVSGRDLENDQKRVAAIATGPATDFVDLLSSVAQRNRGVVVAVSVHTRAQTQVVKMGEGGEAKEIVVGEAPDFGAPKPIHADRIATPYSALWMALHAKANIVWHMFALPPDLTKTPGATLADANEPGNDVTFGAVTMRGTYPRLGAVLWPKRQGGEGWLGWFDLCPRIWHPEVPWPLASGEDGHTEFALSCNIGGDGNPRPLPLPGFTARGYLLGPDAGLVFEQCLREVYEKTGGVA